MLLLQGRVVPPLIMYAAAAAVGDHSPCRCAAAAGEGAFSSPFLYAALAAAAGGGALSPPLHVCQLS